RYCTKDCPQGIDIPEMLRIWSKWRLEKNEHSYKENYLKTAPDARASRCIACGSCESFCPQSIGIIEIMNSMKALNEELGIAE
ncbi:MAG: 4Fe-4S dicluster domain-containing protein, partial [Clostridia bacterium]|nr:4Fe-4S dicluster domain-containing protein [Clostridia bacterium]